MVLVNNYLLALGLYQYGPLVVALILVVIAVVYLVYFRREDEFEGDEEFRKFLDDIEEGSDDEFG